jgi:hypothetical protein
LNRLNFYINVSSIDTNLANISIKIYNSSNALISTQTTSTSPNYWNYTASAFGIYKFNATACDIVNQCNSTETRQITIYNSTISNPNVTITCGARLIFLPNASIVNCVAAYNQTANRSLFSVYNNNSFNMTVSMKLNETRSNIWISCNYFNSCSSAINLTTSYQTITNYTAPNSWNYIWCWAKYNNATASWFPLWSFKGDLII